MQIEKQKSFYQPLREYSNQLDTLYEKGITRGVYCGFESLHPFYTIRPASTTYIFGSPFSGKTEFWFELLVTTSELYGWRHALYTPESGNRAEVVAELISKYCRKQFYKQFGERITEEEYHRGKAWVSEHFYVIDPDDTEMSISDFFTQVEMIEQEFDVRINTTCCDPFNELKHNFNENDGDAGRQDLYIENRLGFIRRNAIIHKRHNSIITHCTDQTMIKGKREDGSDIWFYPPPMARQVAGGQAWFRKAMNLIAVWRPPVGLMMEDGSGVYTEGEAHIIIHKFKPKGTGKRGVVKLMFDLEKSRYYEIFNGEKRYSCSQMLFPHENGRVYEF